MPTHLPINNLDPITVMLSNNAFSEQQPNQAMSDDCQHFLIFLERIFTGKISISV
jgi:hypothetical protein